MFECCICHKYARRTLAEIMRHIKNVHPHFEGIVKCGIESCPSTARSYESLRQHIYKKHKDVIMTNGNNNPNSNASNMTQEGYSNDLTAADDSELDPTNPIANRTNQSSLQAAKFILKTRDGRKLTQTAMDGIIQDTKIIVEHVVDELEQKIMKTLENLGTITPNGISEVLSVFSNSSMRNPFEGMETQCKQEQYFRENLNYVVRSSLMTML